VRRSERVGCHPAEWRALHRGGGEPIEIGRIKRDLRALADDFHVTGEWLAQAMKGSWEAARPLLQFPALAGVLRERHRIIVNDWQAWQAASMATLAARLIARACEIVDHLKLVPAAIRSDLAGPRTFPDYLYAATELLDHAADLASASSVLTHDNERRWRAFCHSVEQVAGVATAPLSNKSPDRPESTAFR
jgi:hypothetical protein